MAGGLAGTVGAPVQSVVVVGNRNDPDHAPILLQHMVAQTAKEPAKRFNPAMRTIVRVRFGPLYSFSVGINADFLGYP